VDFNPLQRERDAFRVLLFVVAAFVVVLALILIIQAL
jgi:hypothetical protein